MAGDSSYVFHGKGCIRVIVIVLDHFVEMAVFVSRIIISGRFVAATLPRPCTSENKINQRNLNMLIH